MIIANFGKFGIEPRRGDMVFANVRGRGFISPFQGFIFSSVCRSIIISALRAFSRIEASHLSELFEIFEQL